MQSLARGAELLDAFIRKHGLTQAAAAEALGVSAPTMHDWLTGAKRPRASYRATIEKWTSGEVGFDAWTTEEELAAAEAIEPFKPSGTDG